MVNEITTDWEDNETLMIMKPSNDMDLAVTVIQTDLTLSLPLEKA